MPLRPHDQPPRPHRAPSPHLPARRRPPQPRHAAPATAQTGEGRSAWPPPLPSPALAPRPPHPRRPPPGPAPTVARPPPRPRAPLAVWSCGPTTSSPNPPGKRGPLPRPPRRGTRAGILDSGCGSYAGPPRPPGPLLPRRCQSPVTVAHSPRTLAQTAAVPKVDVRSLVGEKHVPAPPAACGAAGEREAM